MNRRSPLMSTRRCPSTSRVHRNAVAGDRIKTFGGRYVATTDSITAIDGTPPKRMIIIAFDSMEKAKAFQNDPSQKDIDANRMKNTKSRAFLAEGM